MILSIWTFLIRKAGDICFDDPMTRYVPELAAAATQSSNSCVEYDKIYYLRWDSVLKRAG